MPRTLSIFGDPRKPLSGAAHALPFTALLALGCSSPITDAPGAGDAGSADATETDSADAGLQEAQRLGFVEGTEKLGLNLRTAPGGDVLVVMPDGSLFDILGDAEDGWMRVRYEESEGYASAYFIHEIDLSYEDGFLNLLPWAGGESFRVTQGHGPGNFSHSASIAWDFGMPRGTEVRAAHGGIVRGSRGDGGEGCCDPSCRSTTNWVAVERSDGYESTYLHLSEVHVEAGAVVKRGDVIGRSGNSGYSCGPHLHYQMQLSPTLGGGTGYINPSVQTYFYDSGKPVDLTEGEQPVSQNGIVPLP